MRKVRVRSQKYDGTPRDESEGYLVAETAESVTLFSPPGTAYWDHRKRARFVAPDGLIEIYFKHKWYNVWHICEKFTYSNLIYVNITLPALLEANGIVWVDLDIDYRLHRDNRVERVDQEEFDHNVDRMSYPPDLIEQVGIACREVERGLADCTYPFDHGRQLERYRRIKAEFSAE